MNLDQHSRPKAGSNRRRGRICALQPQGKYKFSSTWRGARTQVGRGGRGARVGAAVGFCGSKASFSPALPVQHRSGGFLEHPAPEGTFPRGRRPQALPCFRRVPGSPSGVKRVHLGLPSPCTPLLCTTAPGVAAPSPDDPSSAMGRSSSAPPASSHPNPSPCSIRDRFLHHLLPSPWHFHPRSAPDSHPSTAPPHPQPNRLLPRDHQCPS